MVLEGLGISPERHNKKPASYPSRLVSGLKLWSEARRAARHDDSIFIWIPKNAGTSVYTVLRDNGLVKLNTTRSIRLSFHNSGRVTFGHIGIRSLVDLGLISPEFVAGAFKFAFARNPYDRAASLYRYLSGTVLPNWHEKPSFEDFLRLIADGHYDRVGAYNVRGLSQASPQVEWLRDAWPDKIYKIEDLREFVSDISGRWRISQPVIPHLNQSHNAARADLTREERALIRKIYAEDFEALGYSEG